VAIEEKPRRILHIDMDAFYASVEQVLNPALKGIPLIIGGEKGDLRGVVSTASYEARVFGVRSAMPLKEAIRLCPHGTFMRGNHAEYAKASRKVRDILESVSPDVEAASIDEAYIDITGSLRLFGGDDSIGKYIKDRIRNELDLPCTIAISPNKLISKVASGEVKPDGYICIAAGGEAAYLRPLDLKKLPGVGPKTLAVLQSLGLQTIGDLAELPQEEFLRVFGQQGLALQRTARGVSISEVDPDRISKSISRETTFERDLTDWAELERVLAYLAERAAWSLREDGLETKCVGLKIRYSDFSTFTFAKSLDEPTGLDTTILETLNGLIAKAKERRAPVRLIGVSLTSLSFDQHQLRLFGKESDDKRERVLQSVDGIRAKHGFKAIHSAKSTEKK
jgi:DNA polymerase-4